MDACKQPKVNRGRSLVGLARGLQEKLDAVSVRFSSRSTSPASLTKKDTCPSNGGRRASFTNSGINADTAKSKKEKAKDFLNDVMGLVNEETESRERDAERRSKEVDVLNAREEAFRRERMELLAVQKEQEQKLREQREEIDRLRKEQNLREAKDELDGLRKEEEERTKRKEAKAEKDVHTDAEDQQKRKETKAKKVVQKDSGKAERKARKAQATHCKGPNCSRYGVYGVRGLCEVCAVRKDDGWTDVAEVLIEEPALGRKQQKAAGLEEKRKVRAACRKFGCYRSAGLDQEGFCSECYNEHLQQKFGGEEEPKAKSHRCKSPCCELWTIRGQDGFCSEHYEKKQEEKERANQAKICKSPCCRLSATRGEDGFCSRHYHEHLQLKFGGEEEEEAVSPRRTRGSLASLASMQSFHHAVFTNNGNTCWFQAALQALWHSSVFHKVFDELVFNPKHVFPLSGHGTDRYLQALKSAWEDYWYSAEQRSTSHLDLTHVKTRLQNIRGYEAGLVKPDARFMADPADAITGAGAALEKIFANFMRQGKDFVVEDPHLTPEALNKQKHPILIVSSLENRVPEIDGDEPLKEFINGWLPQHGLQAAKQKYQLVALGCLKGQHHAVFCRRRQQPLKCYFFNDSPEPEQLEFAWRDVAAFCVEEKFKPHFVMFEAREFRPWWPKSASGYPSRR